MKRKIANSDCEIISFDSTHEELRNCVVIHIECSKYELVFASGGNVVVKPFSSLMEKKQPHHFSRVCQFTSNKL